MRRPLAAAVLAAGATLAGLPALSAAVPPPGSEKLTTPLPTGCYSNPKPFLRNDLPGAVTIPSLNMTGGKPNRRFQLYGRSEDGRIAGIVSGTWDADGNATSHLNLGNVNAGPGQTYDVAVLTPGDYSDPQGSETQLGTVLAAGYGVQVTQPDGSGISTYRQGDVHRLVVSGAPLANKTLYGYYVVNGKQILKRFKLGTADGCGSVEKNVVTYPRGATRSVPKIYVNAGPRLDKAHAVVYRGP